MGYMLSVRNLQTAFHTDAGEIVSVEDVSFDLNPGETLGIVGESGCGKSVTSLSIIRLLGKSGRISKGEIQFENQDLAKMNEKEMRKIRGGRISMIFQEPMTSLNPVFTIGYQMQETICLHLQMGKKESRAYAIEMLKKVGIPRAESVIDNYPHELSGGMRQRVMIAMALSCKPKLLIADEPTTALDVTIQAQILELMKKLRKESGTSIMLITHDLGVVAEMADRIIVMYAGQVIESADVYTLFDHPAHPYTIGLMNSIPTVDLDDSKRLESITGTVPSMYQKIRGCRFCNRCKYVTERCRNEAPPLTQQGEGHLARCFFAGNLPQKKEA
ncbi:Dipeptide transport ATP-binding protein DppD [Caprobacter fermentans]|uniref:Dipeptide transport ATP-binding protein DppD n=1 Tax=Caproicibacter fermentans TaxID=2576756 RepID=A0A6N8HX95_9FIRM|nr:ABC transporter ATP-binding protein [Caproicibacter fermentans]MVB10013.1 Dipeptide transport ATP-binding protein DppD [Caproicibacter fermentans]